ncbi:FMN reductase [Microbacterium sp. NIBRBAC000506063]|uniref:FMN reductase n=1 Tax=Microbacterium sp. NIBRBAC000506063 TaxID=2734618 RepID=UPI001BB656F9|nr:FMN reductase [Microbacterium sp. NIBRBAC000506063]QTV79929.1 FMN reductase [Microbacterium sp. NIBRBAC000506063]
MTAPLRIVAVSGSLHEPSKTTALVRAIADAVAGRAPASVTLIELTDIGPELAGALRRDQLPPRVEALLQEIEGADLLIVGSPVYRASFTGLFKHLFDFVGQYALVGRPVLLAATGGGERHALIIEHQLRPLFAFFQALTLPLGVYASDTDFDGYTVGSEVLQSRIDLAAERALPLVGYANSRKADAAAIVPASAAPGQPDLVTR